MFLIPCADVHTTVLIALSTRQTSKFIEGGLGYSPLEHESTHYDYDVIRYEMVCGSIGDGAAAAIDSWAVCELRKGMQELRWRRRSKCASVGEYGRV